MHTRSECEYIDFYTRFLTHIVSLVEYNILDVVFNLETNGLALFECLVESGLTFSSLAFKERSYPYIPEKNFFWMNRSN